MYNKLTKSELRIIEQTKQQGEQLASNNANKQAGKNGRAAIRSMLLWAAVFVFMVVLAYLLLWLSQGFAKG